MKIFFYASLIGFCLSFSHLTLHAQYSEQDLEQLRNAAFAASNNCGVDGNVISTPDTIICIGDSVQLSAVSPYSFPYWYPSGGLDDPLTNNPIATPSSSQYYYFLQVVEDNTNLIFNGDFELGNVGFTSDYGLAPANWGGVFVNPEGLYDVGNNPSARYHEFEECRDHTGFSGNMLMANGSEDTDDAVWCQTVAVNPNQGYNFEAWFCNLTKKSPPSLMVEINGVQLGNDLDLTIWTCEWEQFTGTWYSANNTSANICIYSTEDDEHGNDFAIDDIRFTSICPVYDSVYIEVSDLQVSAEVTDIDCYQEGFGTIDASITASTPTNFNWVELPGETSLNLDSLSGGTYTLIVSDAVGCTREEVYEVIEPDPLLATIQVDSTNCEGGSMDASQVTGGTTPYNYNWSNGSTDAVLTQLEDGLYSLTITDANNCEWTDAAVVNNIPILEATLSNDSLTCDPADYATILASVSNGTPPFSYSWSTGETDTSIQVFQPGLYDLVITDQNNCVLQLSTNIWQPYRPELNLYISPAVDAQTIFQGGEVVLYANATENPNTYFSWTTSNDAGLGVGNLNSSELALAPVDTGSFSVWLDATSTDGCSESDSIDFQVIELPFFGIPTAFTPNQDGTNDSFYPIDVPATFVQSFQVFNQWGEVVYNLDQDPYIQNNLKGWDGTYKGQDQPSGVYLYVIILDFPGFEEKILRGQVTLIR